MIPNSEALVARSQFSHPYMPTSNIVYKPIRPSAMSCVPRQGFEGDLRHWDITFWAERLREARYQLTDEQLRPFFALPNVLDGLFQARPKRSCRKCGALLSPD